MQNLDIVKFSKWLNFRSAVGLPPGFRFQLCSNHLSHLSFCLVKYDLQNQNGSLGLNKQIYFWL